MKELSKEVLFDLMNRDSTRLALQYNQRIEKNENLLVYTDIPIAIDATNQKDFVNQYPAQIAWLYMEIANKGIQKVDQMSFLRADGDEITCRVYYHQPNKAQS